MTTDPAPPSQAPAQPSRPPALSISVPPPRRQTVMTYVLATLLIGTLLLTFGGAVAYWLSGP